MSPTVETQLITIPRATYRSSIPFLLAESRLRSTIQVKPQSPPTNRRWTLKATGVSHPRSVCQIHTESRIGPHEFMHFTEFDHGTWLKAYYPISQG
ncbi:uncharacterized protein A1O9_10959 [Exophiala aquamarina CBS 119918]|uniref:Uncharacterized protein n=1 Tax=Exophiala aquamarina CBS 119918 TaxID=1182545 RepID=A0A072NZK2_9EURO|nr:uncharacterized protein A1O9_10959 [Exophiala aquamarina CBS 119918]KEF53051.1 hypothetical protein A1O9_10959 [Exophiala aquamarina CBS 119918]